MPQEMFDDAFAYIRVSSEAQAQDDKVSLEEQLLDIWGHGLKTDTRIVRIFKDVASGDDIFRPGFLEMLEEVKAGPVRKIICWNTNRLARGLIATGMVQSVIDDYDVIIEGVRETITSDSFGFQGFMGGIELRYLRMRSRAGKFGKARRGKIPSRNICFGYTVDDEGNPILDEDAARIIRRIFDLSIDENLSAKRIAERLNLENEPTPRLASTLWSKSTIQNILGNEVYSTGIWLYGRNRHKKTPDGTRHRPRDEDKQIEVPVPRIIPRDRWLLARQLSDKRQIEASRNTRNNYLLQGIMYCTNCNRKFACKVKRTRTVKKNGKQYSYKLDPPARHYMCYGAIIDHLDCRKPKRISAERLESFVWNELTNMVLTPDEFLNKLESMLHDPTSRDELERRIRDSERSIMREERAIQRTIELYGYQENEPGTGQALIRTQVHKAVSAIQERLQHHQSILADLQQQIDAHILQEDQKVRFTRWASVIRENIDTLSDEQRRCLVLNTIRRIDIDSENRLTITIGWDDSDGKLASIANKVSSLNDRNRDKHFAFIWTAQLPPPPPPANEVRVGASFEQRLRTTIGNEIRAKRHFRGVGRDELSDKLGVTLSTISLWDNGHMMPDMKNLRWIVELLDIDLSAIVEGSYSAHIANSRSVPLPDTIRRKREESGRTQEDLSRIIAVPTETVREWEEGVALPTLGNLVLLSDELGLNVAHLIPYEGFLDTIGNRLVNRRLSEGLTPGDIRRRFDFPMPSYSLWENNFSFPDPRYWDALSEWLGLSVADFPGAKRLSIPDGPAEHLLGRRIRARRLEKGMSQRKLAAGIGTVTPETISSWERGRTRPRPGYHAALSKILELDVRQTLFQIGATARDGVIPDSLGDYIQIQISISGTSRQALAAQMGANLLDLHAWELGIRVPPRRFHAGLTTFLGLDVNSLPAETRTGTATDPNTTVGRLMISKRQEDNLSQSELAKMLGVRRTTVIGWESDKFFPTRRDSQERLTEWLGVDVTSIRR